MANGEWYKKADTIKKKSGSKWLIEKLEAIMAEDGDRVFSNLLKVFTHLEVEPRMAEKMWKDILKHKEERRW